MSHHLLYMQKETIRDGNMEGCTSTLVFSIRNVFIISCVAVAVMRRLSFCYSEQGRMDRAMPLANEAVRVVSSSLPSNHADLGECTDDKHIL